MTHLSIPPFWRLNKAKYRLVAAKCSGCDKVTFPPRYACPACGGIDFKDETLGIGKMLSWTTIHASPEGFEAPYTVALIKYENGVVLPGLVVGDMARLEVGSTVKPVLRRLSENSGGLLIYGVKFEII